MSSSGDGLDGVVPDRPDEGDPKPETTEEPQATAELSEAEPEPKPEPATAAEGASSPKRPEFQKPEEPAEPTKPDGIATVATSALPIGKDGAAPGNDAKPGTAGKGKKPKKQRSRAARYTRRIAFAALGFIGFAILGFGIAYLLTPVPSEKQSAVEQGAEYYYADGKTLIAKVGTNREAVDIDDVPKHVRDAVISAENRSFYADPGVSVRGTVRAFWSTISGNQLQGGSTITQQMVRNYYQGLGQERTVTRKLKEIMVSLKVGNEKSKDWILEQYLNTIYFGRDAYGIQAAAKAYYGKDVKDLTKAEAAYLAAAIQQPTPFGDPTGKNRAYAEERWRAVVNAMVQTGAATQAEANAMTFPKPNKVVQKDVFGGQNGYMINIARQELINRRGYTEDEINRSGLKITTTFDKDLMDAAKEAVEDTTGSILGKKTRVGLVSVDPKTGQVVAFYGGRDFLKEELSSSFGETPQAGSGFKPIVLATALDKGDKLSHVVDGSSPQTFAGSEVENSGGSSYGMINLVQATQNSVNTAYVNLGQEVGLNNVTEMAEKLGIPAEQLAKHKDAATLPLGVAGVKVVQQAGVYATFADEGVHRTPYVVKSVTDGDGDTKKFTEKGTRVFSQQIARDATYAMSRVVRYGTGTGAQLYDGRDVAGKTGTTDNGNALWFNGFIPQLSTSVSIFRTDGTEKEVQIGGYSAFGGVLPAQIWRSYTAQAIDIENLPPESFGSPSSLVSSYPERRTPRPTGPVSPRPTITRTPVDPTTPVEPTDPGTKPPTEPPTNPKPTIPVRPTRPGGGGGDDDPGSTG